MSATPKVSPAGLAYARSACQRALACFFDGAARPLSEEKQAELRKSIEWELRRAANWKANAADFDEVAAIVLGAPDLDECFIQQTAALDRTGIVRGSNGSSIPIQADALRDAYRVFVRSGKKFAEATNADLLAAVREAFERAKIPLPEGLPK